MPDFKRIGQSKTSPSSNSQRMVVRVPAYVDDKGYIQNANLVLKSIPALEKGSLLGPVAVVMHRTDSTTASSAISSFKRGVGTHFIIDKDGTTYQTASLHQKTWHVGPIKSRCFEEGSCETPEASAIKAMRDASKAVHRHEKIKAYPLRYPMNEDSVGIEVVAKNHGGDYKWDAPTAAQTASIRRLIGILRNEFSLTDDDIYEHDIISRKTAGEGAGLYTDIDDGMSVRFPPPPF